MVHLEVFGDIRDAIAREKEIKAWRREKKIWLIERDNPMWEDLAPRLANEGGTSLEEVDRALVELALRQANGNQTHAATSAATLRY